MRFGGVVSILALLPNILFFLMPASSRPPEDDSPTGLRRWMEVTERAGQAGVFVIPFFCAIDTTTAAARVGLLVAGLCLIFYYAGWLRYFVRGRDPVLIYAPMAGVPLPLAISPIVYFLAASVPLHSWPLVLAAVILAIGHLYVSRMESQRADISHRSHESR